MFIKNHIKDSFFCDVNNCKLDKYQRKVVLDDNDYTLIVAGAGSGKTLTILAKVNYLIEKMGYNEREILCLSFTNETVNNLKRKLKYKVDTYTFHKLALKILKENNYHFFIAQDNSLSYIVNEFFLSIDDDSLIQIFVSYFGNNIKYADALQKKEFIYLKNNIISFIKKIKCNNYTIDDLYKMKNSVLNDKNKSFLLFVFHILNTYLLELKSTLKIDFDDMIVYAKDLVLKKGINRKYRYIIIDEYQDISIIRFNLICAIINSTNAKLMCVGDDYQSIYGFSGSNINLFFDFFKYFPNAKRIDIRNTYRNSYQLIHTTQRFIMKNPYQLRKKINATFLYKNPIVIVYYENNYLETYNNLLNYLYLEGEKEIMVLGRYNSDIKEVQNQNINSMNVRYLTVHCSKGLESENVILLRMENSYRGFPSKIRNDDVFTLFKEKNEEVLYPEERRLFYVALTRCKKRVYLLVPIDNPSIFVQEIKKDACELLLQKD